MMVVALIGTVYLISRNTSNLTNSSLGSTGEGEGLEDIMFVSVQDCSYQLVKSAIIILNAIKCYKNEIVD